MKTVGQHGSEGPSRVEPGRAALAAVAVVVPARDEVDRLGRCLRSIASAAAALRAARPELRVTTTVALDRCRDGTDEVARDAGVDVVTLEAGCVGAARRAGVAHATRRLHALDPATVLLVNTDADCIVPADWLVEMVTLAGDHDLVQGEVTPDPDELPRGLLDAWSERHPAGRGSLHGANLAFRLDAYQRVGGFAEVADQEDLLLVRALLASGASTVGGTRVQTSGRLDGRTPLGFAGYLRDLSGELDG